MEVIPKMLQLDSDLNIGHQTIPNVVEERDPVSDLIRLLQPLTPEEHLGLNQLNIKVRDCFVRMFILHKRIFDKIFLFT